MICQTAHRQTENLINITYGLSGGKHIAISGRDLAIILVEDNNPSYQLRR